MTRVPGPRRTGDGRGARGGATAPAVRATTCVLAVLATAATLTSCAGGEAEPADLSDGGSRATSAPTGAPSASFTPPVPDGTTLPTVGLPTQARAELRRAGRLDAGVRSTWIAYREALSESLRAHRPTAELRRSAGPEVIQMVEERGPRDAADGLTVSLRPLGRLESESTSKDATRLRVCLWRPSVGFFVEANGQEAEGAGPGWVEHSVLVEQDGETMTVTSDEPTGRTCGGGAP